jgi:hypothetical protein
MGFLNVTVGIGCVVFAIASIFYSLAAAYYVVPNVFGVGRRVTRKEAMQFIPKKLRRIGNWIYLAFIVCLAFGFLLTLFGK